ncbi:MAG TPA: sterol-binding protein [Gammaproteobacteria bacterium]|nr:sterol-binding protein [Gammaproteobacteria bacterium]
MQSQKRELPWALWTLESAINAFLSLDEWSLNKVAALEGSLIELKLTGIKTPIFVSPLVSGISLNNYAVRVPDTTIVGSPVTFAGMGLGTGSGLFAGEIEMQGDVELGQEFKRILDNLEIDWEEHLSHLVGDVLAYQIGYHARGLGKWLRRTRRILLENSAEYLRTETQLTPAHTEVEQWLDEVDQLKVDVDRVAAKIEIIRSKVS